MASIMSSKLLQLIIQLKDEASAGLAALGTSLGGLGGILKTALVAGAAAGAVALGGLGIAAVSSASDFQAATARFASVAGSSLAEAGFALEDVKNKALELGAATQFSAAEAQAAMIELAKGGVPIVDVMGQATEATLNLAAAGELGLANAAEIVAKQLGVWADTGVTASQVSDTLAQAANASTVGVEELAMGLAQVGGVAKVSGLGFRELNQTMAMLAPGFGSAADAGTSLKTFLLSLQPTTTNAYGAMVKLGVITTDYAGIADDLGMAFDGTGESMASLQDAIAAQIDAQTGAARGTKEWQDAYLAFMDDFEVNKFYDAEGAFVGMEQAAQILQNGLHGLSEAEQTAALKAAFGTDAFRAAAFIARNGAEGFRNMGLAMEAAGTAAEQAAIRNATFKFAWDSLKGSVETFLIVLGSALLPMLTGVVNGFIPVVNAITTFVQQIMAAPDPLNALVQAVNNVIPGFAPFVAFVSENLPAILSALAAMVITLVVPAFVAWATTAGAAALATLAAMAPIILTVAAVGLAVALLVTAWQENWFGIQDAVAAAWAYIQPVLAQLIAWLQENIPIALQALATLWTQTLLPAIQAFGAALLTAGTTIVSFATSAWASIQTFVANVQAGWNLVTTTTTAAWAAVSSAVSSGVATVRGVIETGISVVSTIVSAIWNTIVFLTSAAWAAVASVVGPHVSAISSTVSAGWATVQAVTSAAWAGVQAVTSAVWSAIVGYVSPAVATVQSVVSAGWVLVQSVTTSVWNALSAIVNSAITTVRNFVTSGVAGVVASLTAGWNTISSVTTAVWSRLSAIVSTQISAVRTIVSTVVAAVKTIVLAAWQAIVAASQNNFSQIPTIISNAIGRVKGILSSGMAEALGALRSAAADAVGLGKAIIDGVLAGISSGAGKIKDKLKDIAKSALDAAKSALGISSPSKAMMQEVGMPIVEGIVVGIEQHGPRAVSAMLDIGQKLVDVVSKGVDAFGKLAQLGEIPQSAIFNFTRVISDVINAFMAVVNEFDKRMVGLATRYAEKSGIVIDMIAKGVDMLGKLSELGPVAPDAIQTFANAMQQAVLALSASVTEQVRIALPAALEFSKMMVGVAEGIGKGVDGLSKVRELAPVAPGTFKLFAGHMASAVAQLGAVAQQFTSQGLASAQTFIAAASKVMELISAGVDAIAKLKDLAPLAPGTFKLFAGYMASAVVQLQAAIGGFTSQGLRSAGEFTDTATKVMGLIVAGIDAILKLKELAPVAPGTFRTFAGHVASAVAQLIAVAQQFSAQAMIAGGTFADGAAKLIGLIGPAVDGLAKLNDFRAVPTAIFATFGASLTTAVAQLLVVMARFNLEAVTAGGLVADGAAKLVALLGTGVDSIMKLHDFKAVPAAVFTIFTAALMAALVSLVAALNQFNLEAVSAAGLLAEGAGKVVGIIAAGVDGLSKLQDFGPVSQVAIGNFVAAIIVTMQRLAAGAVQFAAGALEHAKLFADAAGASVNILKTGVEGLLLVDTFAGVSQAAIDRFAAGVRMAVAAMAALAVQFGAEGTAAAAAFAKTAGESTDFLKKGVEGFAKLAELTDVPLAALDIFKAGIVALINTIIQLSAVVSTQALLQANTFASAIDTVITVVSSALKAFGQLASDATNVPLFVDAIVSTINRLGVDLSAAVVAPSMSIGVAIAQGIARGVTGGTPAIVNAVYAAVNAALAAARAALGIASPSKVFEQQIGLQAGAGLVAGLEGSTAAVSAAATQLARASVSPVAPSGAPVPLSGQQRPLVAGGGGEPSLMIEKGAIVINAQPGQNVEQLAEAVMRKIEQKYKLKLSGV